MKIFTSILIIIVLTLSADVFGAADATVSIERVDFSGCVVDVTLKYCNNGNQRFSEELFLSLYDEHPNTTGKLVGTFVVPKDPNNASLPYCRTFTVKLPKKNYNLHAVINDDGTTPGSAPSAPVAEGNTGNNLDSYNIVPTGDFVDPTEIISNGDFEQGNTGFSSDYAYNNNTDQISQSIYGVTDEPGKFHSQFTHYGDHTSGSGLYMAVNGAPITPGGSYYSVWCQTVKVEPNTNYIFSSWVSSIHPESPAYLQFSINGQVLGQPYTAPPDTNVWIRFLESWFSGTDTIANICIVNLSTVFQGNDFGLDDISLKKCDCNSVNVDLGSDQAVCSDKSVALDATTAVPGVTYKWSTGQTTSKITASQAGKYKVEVHNGSCVGNDEITINHNSRPTIDADPDKEYCLGDTIRIHAQASGGDGNYTYSWTSSGSLSCNKCQTIEWVSTSDRTYYPHVVDGNGCTNSNEDSMRITINSNPSVITLADTAVCSGDEVLIDAVASGGDGNYTYTWVSSPAGLGCSNCNPVKLATTTPRSYIVTVTDGNGCKSVSDSMAVDILSLPTVTAVPDVDICSGDSALITATASGGDGNYTYNWTTSDGHSCNDCDTINRPTGTSRYYYVEVVDGNTCVSAKDSMHVKVNENPSVDPGVNDTICDGGSATLNASGSGGSGNYSYSWIPSTGLSCANCASPTASPLSTTTYEVVIKDSEGCLNQDTATVTLVVNALPVVDAGPDGVMCTDGSAILTASGGETYIWSPSAGLNNPNSANPIATPMQTTTYMVLVTDSNGCQNTDSAIITVHALPSPNAQAGANAEICKFSNTQLAASGGTSYSWTPSNGLTDPKISNPVASPNSTTIYYVQVTDDNGCSQIDSVEVSVLELPTGSAGDDVSICPEDNATLTASGGVSYSWLETGEQSASIVVDPTVNSTYTVVVTDVNGCKDTAQVNVVIYDPPVAGIKLDSNKFFQGDPVVFMDSSSAGVVKWEWEFGDGATSMEKDPEHIYEDSKKYKVRLIVTDGNGCMDTVYKYLKFIEDIEIPNVFTPNGDGINDYFKIKVSGAGEYSLIIMDRWGLKMFESTDPEKLWDGRTLRGKLVPEGVYYYILNVGFVSGATAEETGPATVIHGSVTVQ